MKKKSNEDHSLENGMRLVNTLLASTNSDEQEAKPIDIQRVLDAGESEKYSVAIDAIATKGEFLKAAMDDRSGDLAKTINVINEIFRAFDEMFNDYQKASPTEKEDFLRHMAQEFRDDLLHYLKQGDYPKRKGHLIDVLSAGKQDDFSAAMTTIIHEAADHIKEASDKYFIEKIMRNVNFIILGTDEIPTYFDVFFGALKVNFGLEPC